MVSDLIVFVLLKIILNGGVFVRLCVLFFLEILLVSVLLVLFLILY